MAENDLVWLNDLETALQQARTEGKGVLLQFHRDDCAGCKKLYALTYADAQVRQEMQRWFVLLRADILRDRAIRSRYSAYWTPSFYFLNTRGNMLYSFNGYLNVEDFRVLLRLGKAALDLPRGRYFEVIDLMDDGLARFPENPRAATLLLVRGMAEYLIGKEKSSFRGAMREILERYPQSLEARMWPWMDEP
ncbi:thioredoxin family protein [uncultured Thermanaerothrix sp.]|uniref:thioredoxin family protein n=1 Tax=uncultured Thermanaerothrix sp. TaxID=1195149 RepID=UPI002609E146|nr:thioredoxin family protein [uncultured Thermanaerothrix sp.]